MTNNADPDQLASEEANWSGSTLFAKVWHLSALRKHAYSNIMKILPTKNENFQKKILIFFLFLLKNINCKYSLEPPRRGGSNEYAQSMFLSRNKKNNVYPCKPQFYYIKVAFTGGQNYIGMFSWWGSAGPG